MLQKLPQKQLFKKLQKQLKIEDLIGNKMSDQIISVGKSKEKEKTKKVEEIYIPQENVYDQSKKIQC